MLVFLVKSLLFFTGTIRENLELGKEGTTEEKMIEIQKKVTAYKFVKEMNNGLDTFVGIGGADLSRGEKQRIARAMVIVNDGKILLLDKATIELGVMHSKQYVLKLLDKMK